MKFRYEPVPMRDGSIDMQPRVDVIFTNPKTGRHITVKALVDSGAGMTVLNAAFAELLGVDVTDAPQRSFMSANSSGTGYDYELKIKLKQDMLHEHITTCSFMPNLRTDALLGQVGFFENFRIVFERYKNHFELTPK